MNIVFQ